MLQTTYFSDRTILIEGNREQLRLFAQMNHFEMVQRSRLFQFSKAGQPAGWIIPGKGQVNRGLFSRDQVQVWTLECMIVPVGAS